MKKLLILIFILFSNITVKSQINLVGRDTVPVMMVIPCKGKDSSCKNGIKLVRGYIMRYIWFFPEDGITHTYDGYLDINFKPAPYRTILTSYFINKP